MNGEHSFPPKSPVHSVDSESTVSDNFILKDEADDLDFEDVLPTGREDFTLILEKIEGVGGVKYNINIESSNGELFQKQISFTETYKQNIDITSSAVEQNLMDCFMDYVNYLLKKQIETDE